MAPSVGFGGFYQGRWFASPWPPQLLDAPQSSALFELYPLVVAAFLWGKDWSASSILVHCDNEAAVHCKNKGHSHSPALMPLLRRLIWISACNQFIIIAKHVPGSKNLIADSFSFYVSEIQSAGSGDGPISYSSSSLFATHLPINQPLNSLLNASLDSILQAVSPRTIQFYLTAWRCFKGFHLSYNLPFPDFSLSITSFVSYFNTCKNLQARSIKGYLSGIQFFHKLIYGAPSPEINNSQTSLLIKGIQRSHPPSPNARKPITLDILSKCIHILRTGYRSHTRRYVHTGFFQYPEILRIHNNFQIQPQTPSNRLRPFRARQ